VCALSSVNVNFYELTGAKCPSLVPSLIEGLRVVQGLRVVPVFVYRYSMTNLSKKGSYSRDYGGGQIRLAD
jgi:hypothetical protein